jgi:hypothetical protein
VEGPELEKGSNGGFVTAIITRAKAPREAAVQLSRPHRAAEPREKPRFPPDAAESASPLPQLKDEVAVLASRVEEYIKKMGAV